MDLSPDLARASHLVDDAGRGDLAAGVKVAVLVRRNGSVQTVLGPIENTDQARLYRDAEHRHDHEGLTTYFDTLRPYDGSLGTVSSIPQPPDGHTRASRIETPLRGGETVPSGLMLAVMKAHRAWALRFAPHLLEEWVNQ